MLKKHASAIAFILAVIMIISIISVSTGGFGLLNVRAEQTGSDDKKVAGDISNLTGIDVNSILSMKNEGLSWNEIMEKLKDIQSMDENNRRDRNNFLLNQSVDEETINRLKKEGFSEEEIIEARLLIERVQFQLNEITKERMNPLSEGSVSGTTEDELSAYEELAAGIDMVVCLPLLLRLKKDFGSYEKALDEYLLSLQLNMDLSLYLEDKEAYLMEKNAKSFGKKLITVQSIEEKMLLKLQEENMENMTHMQSLKPAPTDIMQPNGEASGNIPDIPEPKIDSVIPENPADALINEINELDPMKNK